MSYTDNYFAAITAAERENQKLTMERTTFKANEPIVKSLKEINKTLEVLKELVSDMVGILKYMDLNAYGQYRLQQAYEQSIIDGEQG